MLNPLTAIKHLLRDVSSGIRVTCNLTSGYGFIMTLFDTLLSVYDIAMLT